jgi:hypothetical protein
VDNVVLGCKGAFQAYLEDPGLDGMNAHGNQKFIAKYLEYFILIFFLKGEVVKELLVTFPFPPFK